MLKAPSVIRRYYLFHDWRFAVVRENGSQRQDKGLRSSTPAPPPGSGRNTRSGRAFEPVLSPLSGNGESPGSWRTPQRAERKFLHTKRHNDGKFGHSCDVDSLKHQGVRYTPKTQPPRAPEEPWYDTRYRPPAEGRAPMPSSGPRQTSRPKSSQSYYMPPRLPEASFVRRPKLPWFMRPRPFRFR